MRGFIKSTLRFSWAMSLFGVQQLENIVDDSTRGDGKTADAFDSVASATEAKLGGNIRSVFKAGERLQGGMVDMMFGAPGAGPGQPFGRETPAGTREPYADARPVHCGRLNTQAFVVLGEGLAAGVGDFTLCDETQAESFPAQMARQMRAEFPQPLIQPPGICSPVGFAELPVLVPAPPQTTVLDRLPPVPVNNLSVPNYTLADALNLRPSQPLVRRDDAKQTAANLILGLIPIAYGEGGELPTQAECAVNRRPTFTLVELGYYEALEAAVKGDPSRMPAVDAFVSGYETLLRSLVDSGSEVLVLNVPDPFDTAHFSDINLASKILKLEHGILSNAYGLGPRDLLTANGLNEIGFQLFGRRVDVLPDGCVVGAEVADEVGRRVAELNAALAHLARECGVHVYDLHAFFRRVKRDGVAVGTRRLTAEYLGGFYTLNGYYPGATGHALIANELLHKLNVTYGSDFPQVNVQAVMNDDPVASYRQAEGPNWTAGQLPPPTAARAPRDFAPPLSAVEDVTGGGAANVWEELEGLDGVSTGRLRLPPGLEQVLPLSAAASYFGDGITPLNCRDPQGVQTGGCGRMLFGGLAMVDSHLSGRLRIRFTPPQNDVTRFEVSFMEGFAGEDTVLAAPQFFKMTFQQARVDDVPGMVSSGTLNLATGEVSDLNVYAGFAGTALFVLLGMNPSIPRQPLNFPGRYGSAWARFEQRADGLLDFTFYGSTYLPLGANIRWPLPFFTPTQQFATVPASGSVLHPHLSLSTKEPEAAGDSLDVPPNTLQELTLFTHNSSFGDAFTLNSPQLGGGATGRSHVLGRALLQFGPRSGNSVPVAVYMLNAGGQMAEMPASPIVQAFPGRLYPGPHGFNETLRFPLKSYPLDSVVLLDDPFDISIGAVDLKTGRFLNELLHRGFINQDLIFALMRVEPRTPQSSFFWRGPAMLERGAGGQLVFRYRGQVRVPYPEGFLFPSPNLTTPIVIGPNSRLDPFLWIHALQDKGSGQTVKRGEARDRVASTGDRFSYSYEIPYDPACHPASFEYENHTQQGSFRMHSLAWVGFGDSGNSCEGPEEFDTVTFSCFGVWSKDGTHTVQQATVQISTSPQRPYVGIQVDAGGVSNVNTKPPNLEDVRP